MPLLLTANILFDQAGTSRISYVLSNTINIVSNTNGIVVTQNTVIPQQSNTVNIGSTSNPVGNLHISSNRALIFGNNVAIQHNKEGLNVTGTGKGLFLNSRVYVPNSGPPTNLRAPTRQLFTSSGTYSIPAGCRSIKVTVIGGGGGGGGAQYSGGSAFGGGGESGCMGIKWLDISSWSNTTTVTIGNGGSSGSASGANGSDGGTSSFGSHLSCPGGGGGLGMTGGATNNMKNGGISAPNATGADINVGSCAGGYSLRYSNLFGCSGDGGGILSGALTGGHGQNDNDSYPYNGACYGAGGEGGSTINTSSTGRAGGAGLAGCVLVEEYY